MSSHSLVAESHWFFHVLLVELWLLLVAEVEEGDRQEEGWEVESGVGRVKEKQQRG